MKCLFLVKFAFMSLINFISWFISLSNIFPPRLPFAINFLQIGVVYFIVVDKHLKA